MRSDVSFTNNLKKGVGLVKAAKNKTKTAVNVCLSPLILLVEYLLLFFNFFQSFYAGSHVAHTGLKLNL